MLAQPVEVLRQMGQPTLIIHGRVDKVIPAEVSVALGQVLPDADLMILARCGHRTRIERRDSFVSAAEDFLSREAEAGQEQWPRHPWRASPMRIRHTGTSGVRIPHAAVQAGRPPWGTCRGTIRINKRKHSFFVHDL